MLYNYLSNQSLILQSFWSVVTLLNFTVLGSLENMNRTQIICPKLFTLLPIRCS